MHIPSLLHRYLDDAAVSAQLLHNVFEHIAGVWRRGNKDAAASFQLRQGKEAC